MLEFPKYLVILNFIYPLQFSCREKHSTTDALISLTETIRKSVDGESIASGIFVDQQKTFDTVEHNILLAKLKHFGVWGNANELFKSYLSNRKQIVGHDSNLASILYWVC